MNSARIGKGNKIFFHKNNSIILKMSKYQIVDMPTRTIQFQFDFPNYLFHSNGEYVHSVVKLNNGFSRITHMWVTVKPTIWHKVVHTRCDMFCIVGTYLIGFEQGNLLVAKVTWRASETVLLQKFKSQVYYWKLYSSRGIMVTNNKQLFMALHNLALERALYCFTPETNQESIVPLFQVPERDIILCSAFQNECCQIIRKLVFVIENCNRDLRV